MKSSTSATFSSLDPGEQQGLSPSIQIENLFKWIFIVGGLPGPLHIHCLMQIHRGMAGWWHRLQPVISRNPAYTMTVRHENPADPAERLAIRSVNEAAFVRPDEADLVDTLRAENVVLLSLVAESERRVVGHILFSRIWINDAPAVALAPVAVLPEYQRRGIAATLISRGVDSLRTRGERIILVLGHPEYYQRFGFAAKTARNLETPFPPEAFMAIELTPGALASIRGKVRYPGAFGLSPEHTY